MRKPVCLSPSLDCNFGTLPSTPSHHCPWNTLFTVCSIKVCGSSVIITNVSLSLSVVVGWEGVVLGQNSNDGDEVATTPCDLCAHPQPTACFPHLHCIYNEKTFMEDDCCRHLKIFRAQRKLLVPLRQGHVPRLFPEGFLRMYVIRSFIALCWGTETTFTYRLMLGCQVSPQLPVHSVVMA